MQGAVKREYFAQSVKKKNTLQLLIVTSAQGKANWEIKVPVENSMTFATTKMKSRVVSMCIVPVKVRHVHFGNETQTYAMLDCFSKGTFINTDLAMKLNAVGMKTTIKIKALNGEDTHEFEAIIGESV